MKRGVSAVTKAEAVWPMLCVLGVPVLLIGLPWIAHALQWPWMLVDWLAGRTMPWFYPHQDSWYFFWLWCGVAAVSVACLRAAWRERDLTPAFGVPLSLLTALAALAFWGPAHPDAIARLEQAEKARTAQWEAMREARALESATAAAGGSPRAWEAARSLQLARAQRAADALASGRTADFRAELEVMKAVATRFTVNGYRLPAYRSAMARQREVSGHRSGVEASQIDLLRRRTQLAQAVAASDERDSAALGALVPIEYILAINADRLPAGGRDPGDGGRDVDGARDSIGERIAPPSLQTARRLAESRLLIDPGNSGAWRGWALLMDPDVDEVRMRGGLIAAGLLEQPDSTSDMVESMRLRTLHFSADKSRLEKLRAIEAKATQEAAAMASPAEAASKVSGSIPLPTPPGP